MPFPPLSGFAGSEQHDGRVELADDIEAGTYLSQPVAVERGATTAHSCQALTLDKPRSRLSMTRSPANAISSLPLPCLPLEVAYDSTCAQGRA